MLLIYFLATILSPTQSHATMPCEEDESPTWQSLILLLHFYQTLSEFYIIIGYYCAKKIHELTFKRNFNMSYKTIIYRIIIGLGILYIGYTGYIFIINGNTRDNIQVTNMQPSNIITSFQQNTIKIGGDFSLTHHNGTSFKFSSLNGKPTLMYFGFTHCPDFCPTSLQIMDAVSNSVDINRVFISVDPERDTVDALSDYASLYKDGLIALTGTLAETDSVAKQWYIHYSFNKKNSTDKNYTVDHTTYLYLTNKQGKLLAMIRPEATPQEIIDFIKKNSD
jgi:cytochrome oxidase Cu insertion factor (SCO1/SenC/PrrC family)